MVEALLNFLGIAFFVSICLAFPVSMWLRYREARWVEEVSAFNNHEYRTVAERDRHMETRRREFHAWLDTHP